MRERDAERPSGESNITGEQVSDGEEMRLSRFLAQAGIASRRHAEDIISAGRVRVNGELVTTQGVRIDPAHDRVQVDGKTIQSATRHVYLLLNKPAGYLSTAHDPQHRPTVLDLLPPELRRLRVYPVGRLDRDSSGLLLLTNDGDFALRMTHPRYSTEKHYEAYVEGCPQEDALEMLSQGVKIHEDDGKVYLTSPAQVQILRRQGKDCRLSITIHEGHKRQVRRMLAAVGYPVRQLVRVGIGPLTLHSIAEGRWRYLTERELQLLRKSFLPQT